LTNFQDDFIKIVFSTITTSVINTAVSKP